MSRSPHGERGLKSSPLPEFLEVKSRSPHGERGLKSEPGEDIVPVPCRSPHGERGLKLVLVFLMLMVVAVAPHTGSVD